MADLDHPSPGLLGRLTSLGLRLAFHWQPVRSTYTIASNTCRAGLGGRPAPGLRTYLFLAATTRCGISGSTRCQKASVTAHESTRFAKALLPCRVLCGLGTAICTIYGYALRLKAVSRGLFGKPDRKVGSARHPPGTGAILRRTATEVFLRPRLSAAARQRGLRPLRLRSGCAFARAAPALGALRCKPGYPKRSAAWLGPKAVSRDYGSRIPNPESRFPASPQTAAAILKIGRYIATTMPPTRVPISTMMKGSSRLDRASTALLTSCS